VSAVGVSVDTSNRVVKQIFDVSRSRVTNEVGLDFGTVFVSGTFRQSKNVPNRAVVSFRDLEVRLNVGLRLKLGFVFDLVGLVRQSRDNGWLETTFIDEDMRIGRGNKGTMFVLTRDISAVVP